MSLDERPVFKVRGDSAPLSAFEAAIRNIQTKHVKGLEYLEGILSLAGVQSPTREVYYDMGRSILERSSNTFAHSMCVTGLCLDFVHYDNGDSQLKQTLGGVILHDVGKLELDYSARSRKTIISKDELASIYEHPKKGAEILLRVSNELSLQELLFSAYIAGMHHVTASKKKSYGVDIGLPESMRPLAEEAVKIVRIFDFLDSMEFGGGKSMSLAQYNTNDKQAVIRTMSNHFHTTDSGPKVERDPLIEKAVEFYWRHRPRDQDYLKLMQAILKKAA